MAIDGRLKYYLSLLNPVVAAGYLAVPRKGLPEISESLRAAIDWLCRAQDARSDGGVARSFSLAYNPYFRQRGWLPSYPETTGYIIPTIFDCAIKNGSEELFKRAVRMADWECDVQMANGAVQGGTIADPPSPAVFNTGQVIFGWVRAYRETGASRYLESAVKAGDFLLSRQDPDGAWRRDLSKYASATMPFYTYNTRTAWALLLLGNETGNKAYRDGAVRNIEFALTQQLPNGWFKNNCLSDPARPLLHTIAYALEGVLECGIMLNSSAYIGAVRKAAEKLLHRQREDGSLAGRFDENWEPVARYSCLTGNAQMGIVWARLHQITSEKTYLDGAVKVNQFLRKVQWLNTGNPGLDGGISGSFPLHGEYGRFEVLNWAVKFFVDSLLLEDSITRERDGS